MPRVALDLLRELGLDARHLSSRKKQIEDRWPVVVMGAGDMGTLLLDHLKSSAHDVYPGMRLLGFIDESELMYGRRLRSFRILGGLSAIPKLVEEAGLKGIIVAITHPRQELLDALDALAKQYDLTIYRWKVGLVKQ